MLAYAHIMGRICNDLDLKQTSKGTKVINVTLASQRDYSSNGEKETDFFNIVMWGKLAERLYSFCSKGQLIVVSGRLQNTSYINKEGKKTYRTDLIAENFNFAEPKRKYNDSKNYVPQNSEPEEPEEIEDLGDLPF